MLIKPVKKVLSFLHSSEESRTIRLSKKKSKNGKRIVTNMTITLYGRNGMIAKLVIK